MTDRWVPNPASSGGFEAAVAETHISLLIFAGDRAYKLKKSIRTPFLDFSSVQLRRQACEREVELNRRLAPDVYLGVADMIGPDGQPCDCLMVMKRMPPERRLAHLIGSGEGEPCLAAVARLVAAFHAGAEAGPAINAAGTRDAVLERWEANIAEIQPLAEPLSDPSLPDRIARLARTYLSGREPLFDRRIAEGRIRDGHGDLLADDIFCLDDGPRILDCLEFDDRLRYVDVLDDAAFLAMDLERIGGPQIGWSFLNAYREAAGGDHPTGLAHHYMAYRAHVRAKIALIRHRQGDPEALTRATKLLEMAERNLRQARVVLLLVGGLPGTGKSTLARGLAERLSWSVLRSDEIRKKLAGPGGGSGYREGIYNQETTGRTYEAMLDRAAELLRMGVSVVLDASWSSAAHRLMAADLARESSAELLAVRCEAPADLTARRMLERTKRGDDPSDATPAIAGRMAAEFDDWPQAAGVDASGTVEQTLMGSIAALGRSLPEPSGG